MHFLPIIDFNKSWIPATSMAVMCKKRRRADHAGGRGGVAGQCKGEHQTSVVLQVLAREWICCRAILYECKFCWNPEANKTCNKFCGNQGSIQQRREFWTQPTQTHGPPQPIGLRVGFGWAQDFMGGPGWADKSWQKHDCR
jgi:hypothetical protein